MDININKVIFCIPNVIENTTRSFPPQLIELKAYNKDETRSFHPQLIELKAYNKDESICPVRAVVEYIKATEKIGKSENLIISYHKHNIVYVKQTLKAAGINPSLFIAHSTRHSSSSKTFMKGLPLTDIVKRGGWKSTSTFRKFYNLPILNI